MLRLFYPTMLKKKITDITVNDLEKLGVKGLLLDVDNTLTTHGSQFLSEDINRWLKDMADKGYLLTVVSNGLPKRVAPFAQRLGLRHIAFACKPSPLGFLRGAKRLGLSRKECVAIGDQTFTDILGAKLAGIKSIQLIPIEYERDKPTLRFKRMLEKRILKSYLKKHTIVNFNID